MTAPSGFAAVAKPFLAFVLLFLGYNLALMALPPGNVKCQNQWQQNSATAEDYIFSSRPGETVIVGSSMSARLDNGLLGTGFRNLSFSAGSAATGLEIIRRCGFGPKLVLIETNRLMEPDSGFVSGQFRPVPYLFKSYLPSARTRNQPVNLFVTWVKKKGGGKDPAIDSGAFANLVGIQRHALLSKPDPDSLRRRMDILAGIVSALSQRGVQIAFFRMPTYPALDSLPGSVAVLDRFVEAFPRDRFRWIELPPESFRTSDGIHLTHESAMIFAGKLKERLSSDP